MSDSGTRYAAKLVTDQQWAVVRLQGQTVTRVGRETCKSVDDALARATDLNRTA